MFIVRNVETASTHTHAYAYVCMYIHSCTCFCCSRAPFSSKKKFHLWITLWIPWDMSSCTSEEQVTLHIENCMGCPHFHKWKFKWKFFEVPRDFTCSLYSFFVWPVTCRWHVPSEITCENKIFSMSFHLWNHLQVTRPKWNHLWKS